MTGIALLKAPVRHGFGTDMKLRMPSSTGVGERISAL
jgi:hypothetical protein